MLRTSCGNVDYIAVCRIVENANNCHRLALPRHRCKSDEKVGFDGAANCDGPCPVNIPLFIGVLAASNVIRYDFKYPIVAQDRARCRPRGGVCPGCETSEPSAALTVRVIVGRDRDA